jgi:hypothetical protein
MMADVEKGKNPENLVWQAPTENVDGSPISGPLSYNLYRKDAAGEWQFFYVIVGELDFPEGSHEIVLTAVDAEGDESAYSNSMGFTIGVAPKAPVIV